MYFYRRKSGLLLLESASGSPYLLPVEHRECRSLNAIRVRYHEIDCECLAIFGDFAADLAYLLASSFQREL
jgi:hypothetical protein